MRGVPEGIMLRVLLAVLSVMLLATAAAAAPLCPEGKHYSDYVALGAGGCVLGDKLFANFQLLLGPNDGAATTPKADQIGVAPLNQPRNPGFSFSGNPDFASPPADSALGFFSWRFRFTVAVQPGGGKIEDASIDYIDPTAEGNASSSAQELLCLGGKFVSKGICADGIAQTELNLRQNENQPDQTADHKKFGQLYDPVDLDLLAAVAKGTEQDPGGAR